MKKEREKLTDSNNELLIRNKIFGIKILGGGESCYDLARLLGRVGLIINSNRNEVSEWRLAT